MHVTNRNTLQIKKKHAKNTTQVKRLVMRGRRNRKYYLAVEAHRLGLRFIYSLRELVSREILIG